MLRTLATLVLGLALAVPALPARAEPGTEAADRLLAALRVSEFMEIHSGEGIRAADEIATEMLGGHVAERWETRIAQIYAPGTLEEIFVAELTDGLDLDTTEAALDFFESGLGARVIALDLDARAALADPDIEDSAIAYAEELREEDHGDVHRADAFIRQQDLVEQNVAGTLTSNLAFLRGLADGGAFDPEPTEAELAGQVWTYEPEIRAETEKWVYGYVLMAYAPLSDAEFAALTEYYGSPEGAALWRAWSAAYDALFTEVSYATGRAAAEEVLARDL